MNAGILELGDWVYDIAIDPAGQVVVVGTGAGTSFVAKFDSDLGSPLWRLDQTGEYALSEPSIAVDSAGNVFVAGSIETCSKRPTSSCLHTMATATRFGRRSKKRSSDIDRATAIATSTRGDVFVVGFAGAALYGSSDYSAGTDCFILHIR